jgi:RNA-directed DNA polymerase
MGKRKISEVLNITEGFDFLSWNFRKYRGKLLIKPSRESIQKFVEKNQPNYKSRKRLVSEILDCQTKSHNKRLD